MRSIKLCIQFHYNGVSNKYSIFEKVLKRKTYQLTQEDL
jgi:3-deoxy-D-manno-octulosonate 8-phosphate phosphatase KdsC-like HAD superfamily phosphatase